MLNAHSPIGDLALVLPIFRPAELELFYFCNHVVLRPSVGDRFLVCRTIGEDFVGDGVDALAPAVAIARLVSLFGVGE